MDSLSQFSLAGKRALVTGSSRGIGFAIAAALAGAGADIILNSRDTEALGEARREPRRRRRPRPGGGVRRDQRRQRQEAVDYIESEVGPIDILVNNAGMQYRAPLEDFPDDHVRADHVDQRRRSVFLVGQAVAKRMIPRGAGKIINICSLMSGVARPTIAPYAASKAAVANLTRGMATEWARHGLNVNGIAPGYFQTELNEALVKDPEFNAWLEKRTPMGRWGEVEELGGAAIFLASNAARFVNGHILYVDGALHGDGLTMAAPVLSPRDHHLHGRVVERQDGDRQGDRTSGSRVPFLDGDDFHSDANKEKCAPAFR